MKWILIALLVLTVVFGALWFRENLQSYSGERAMDGAILAILTCFFGGLLVLSLVVKGIFSL